MINCPMLREDMESVQHMNIPDCDKRIAQHKISRLYESSELIGRIYNRTFDRRTPVEQINRMIYAYFEKNSGSSSFNTPKKLL